jgi:PAS domain S-box-containing protein
VPDSFQEKVKILHVDDEPEFADMAGAFLERADDRFETETATSADDGLAIISDRPPDCIVSDYDMPRTDGLEFLEAVRAEHPNLPFILFTGKGSETIASDAIAAGVTDYLQKGTGPEQYELLANRIHNAVAAQQNAKQAARQRDLLQQTEILGATGGWELHLESEEVRLTGGLERLYDFEPDRDTSLEDVIELYDAESQNIIRSVIDRAVNTGDAEADELHLQTANGEQRIVEGTATLVESNKKDTLLRGVIRDVTDREEQRQELESERRFIQQALDAIDDVFYVLDADGVLQRWNEQVPASTGYAESALDGMAATELFPADQQEKIADSIEATLTGGEATVEASISTASEERIPYEFSGTRLTDEDGTATGLVGIGRELTERRQRRQQLQAIIQGLTDAVYVLDETGRFTYVNDEFVELVGYDRETILGSTSSLIKDETAAETAEHQLGQLLSSDGPDTARFEVLIHPREGDPITCEDHMGVLPYEGEAFDGSVGVLRDISEQKEYERELEMKNERLEEFASIVSHDLRNPLGVAKGHLKLAMETSEDDHLNKIRNAINRSEALIDDLLTLARDGDEVAETERVELPAVVEQSWQTVETKQATLDTDGLGVIEADRSRVQELFENLFRNAVEHGGSAVTVHVEAIDDGFYVADTGPGIADSDHETVFEAGYSTAEEGTGFGLRIVEQVVEAHGWDLAVTESAYGGARFEVASIEIAEQ